MHFCFSQRVSPSTENHQLVVYRVSRVGDFLFCFLLFLRTNAFGGFHRFWKFLRNYRNELFWLK